MPQHDGQGARIVVPMPSPYRIWATCILFLTFCYLQIPTAASADLLALWMAGHVFGLGQFDLVYPPAGNIFTMLPPEGWFPILQKLGITGYVFPYVYPPIWAALAAPLTLVADFPTFQAVMTVLNPLLLVGCVIAAWRLASYGLPPETFLLVGLSVLLLSSVGSVALNQNQPQILVAFLTLWSIERVEKAYPLAGGVLLALAAAIKIYPALYVIFWLAGRQYRASFAFFLAGAVLAGFSVYLCGWPLHAQFLELLRSISRTAMLTNYSYIWESVVGGWLYDPLVQTVTPHPVNPGDPALVPWTVLGKPKMLSLAFHLAQLAAIAAFAVAFRRAITSGERALLWPVAFAGLSLLGPMSWTYHYISVVAFAPCVLGGFGWKKGGLMLIGFVILTSPYLRLLMPGGPVPTTEQSRIIQFMGTLAMSLLAYALFRLHCGTPKVASQTVSR